LRHYATAPGTVELIAGFHAPELFPRNGLGEALDRNRGAKGLEVMVGSEPDVVHPGVGVDFQALQHRHRPGGNGSALVFAQGPAGMLYPLRHLRRDPAAAVLIAEVRLAVIAAQKGTAHTATVPVITGRPGVRDLFAEGAGHGDPP
jgi:hypothetical protein